MISVMRVEGVLCCSTPAFLFANFIGYVGLRDTQAKHSGDLEIFFPLINVQWDIHRVPGAKEQSRMLVLN